MVAKTKDNRIRTKLDTFEDILRIVSSGAYFATGSIVATENILQNAGSEILENIGYAGVNGVNVIARAAISLKRGVQDTCSLMYRALSNKEQLVNLHELDELGKSIDERFKSFLADEGKNAAFEYKKSKAINVSYSNLFKIFSTEGELDAGLTKIKTGWCLGSSATRYEGASDKWA